MIKINHLINSLIITSLAYAIPAILYNSMNRQDTIMQTWNTLPVVYEQIGWGIIHFWIILSIAAAITTMYLQNKEVTTR